MIKATDEFRVLVRMPADIKAWIEKQSAHNCSSQNSEVVRALRAAIDAERRAGGAS